MNTEDIRKFVLENCIDAEIIEHKESGLTSKNASDVHGVDMSNIVKTLLFVGKGSECIVICLGRDRVDTKKLEALGIKKPHIANREELKSILNAEPGGVPPIGLPDDIRKFVDKGVMEKAFVIGSAGSEFSGIRLNPKDILQFSNAELSDIVE